MLNLFGTMIGWPGTVPARGQGAGPGQATGGGPIEEKVARGRLERRRGWHDEGLRLPAVPAGYAAQVRDAYLANPVAQRACRLVASAVAGAPLASADTELLKRVTSQASGGALLETVATQLLLHGNAYIQVIDDGGQPPRVGELFALRPDRVAVELDGRGWPIAYAYRVGGEVQRLPAHDGEGRCAVIHLRLPNPIDDHYGLGCLSAAAQSVAIHNAACRWNHALLANAARPSGALVHEAKDGAGPLSAAQFERLRDELVAQFQGSGNAGRPMLLEGGLKWQPLSLSPAEMDFQRLKDSAARDIAMAFGVPPMLIGLTGDATYANYREASKALWRQTVLPLLGMILAGLNEALAAWHDDAALTIQIDKITALAEDRERHWAQIAGADFLTAAEKRALLDIAVPTGEQPASPEAAAATAIQKGAC